MEQPAVMSMWPSWSKSAMAQPSATNSVVRVCFLKVTLAADSGSAASARRRRGVNFMK
jgi:hypothetical protein